MVASAWALNWSLQPRLRSLYLQPSCLRPPSPFRAKSPCLQAVTYIGLQGNGIGGGLPPSWGNLTGLQLLDLGRNRLGRDFPPEWGAMRGLQALNLVRHTVGGQGIRAVHLQQELQAACRGRAHAAGADTPQ